jgi:hypothetical protein
MIIKRVLSNGTKINKNSSRKAFPNMFVAEI